MPILRIIVEGHTEERVVKEVLAPHLAEYNVWATPTLVNNSSASASRVTKGGGKKYQSYRRDIILTLKQNSAWYVTTMLDFYGLPADFPTSDHMPSDGHERINALESALDGDIRSSLGDIYPWRFIPYIQRHELEALLFVDPEATAAVILPGDARYSRQLRQIRDAPEEINDGQHSAPSKRLGGSYRKTLHATKAIAAVGISAIREVCPHFNEWLSRLETLGAEHPL